MKTFVNRLFTVDLSQNVKEEETLKVERSQLRFPGEFRHLHVDRYKCDARPSRVVIMTTAFIENGYWYQIEKKGYSLAKRIAQEGYDVYVLSFQLNEERLNKGPLPPDASFTEIVTLHLPKFHQQISEQYSEIHYVGHSYGVTILLAFLLGYQKSMVGEFAPHEKAVKDNTRNVKSFISIAGLFKLTWPEASKMTSFDILRTWPYPVLDKAARIPFAKAKFPFSLFPIKRFSPWLRYLPTYYPVSLALRFYENLGLLPSFHFANADLKALIMALSNGTSDESLETFLTVLNLHPQFDEKETRRQALSHFTEDLEQWKIPICFIQGELDQITHPDIIHQYGYTRIPASKKSFTSLKNTGHQDILTARNPELLFHEIRGWLASS